MKQALAITLAAIMLTAALAGCAKTNSTLDPQIRMTSSDALSAAEWLDARLDTIPDRIVMGTDAEGYGVDVSTLEDDGYFIRNLGGEVALFAKTDAGLDRAVRKYAKAVESGTTVEDATYHEGYRIEEFELAGRDISEYTIYCEDDKYMPTAANRFAGLIKEACGASMPVSTAEPTAPYIAMKYVKDDALGYVGYRWNVTEDGLTMECSDLYPQESATVASFRFLVDKLDWFGLDFGMEDLPEADLITVSVGESGGETPYFDWVNPGALYIEGTLDSRAGRLWLGPRTVADSGIQINAFGRDLADDYNGRYAWQHNQPCYTDEDYYQAAKQDIIDYIESKLDAGMEIGKDFYCVDIAQADNNRWCNCKNCQKVLKAEGSQAGAYYLWANRMSDELNELYPGIIYETFAYDDTKVPPKTVTPNDHLYVTFCYDHSCSSHCLEGTHCTTYDNWSKHDNPTLSTYLKRWDELTPGPLGVWYYTSCDGLASMSVVHTVKDDLTFLYDNGVRSIYWENKSNCFDTNRISQWLSYLLYWDIYMSDEEFDSYYDRILRVMYGDAAESVKYYITLSDISYECGPCKHAWNGFASNDPINAPFNRERLAETFDLTFDLLENAILIADSGIQEDRLIKLQCSDIFIGCISAYQKAIADGDTARMTELEERYALINQRLTKCGFNMAEGFPDYSRKPYETELSAYFQ